MKQTILILAAILSVHTAKTETVEWVGGIGDWNVASNWDCACIPDTAQGVWIADGTVTIPMGVFVHVESIRIQSAGNLFNYDTILVSSPISYGIRVNGRFENHGFVNILSSTGLGVHIDGDMINHGHLLIDSIPADALGMEEDSALLENYGLIEIICYDGEYGIYSFNPISTLYNAPSGVIEVSRGFSNASNIEFYGFLHNQGVIDLYDGDVGGLGTLINEGLFSMDNPIDHAQQGFQMRNLFNMEEGTFRLRNTSSYGFIYNDTIINYGDLDVKNTFSDVVNLGSGYMINYGEIRIDSVRRYGILTGTNSVFRNESGASIHISRSRGAGLRIQQIEFYNNGLIELDTIGSNLSTDSDFGIQCVTGGSFFNDTLGQILIDSCYSSGISLGTSLSSLNHGVIHIRRARQNGIAMSSNHSFTNTGTIDIDTVLNEGLTLSGTSTSFHNYGVLTIGPMMDLADFSIYNASTFINDTCGNISTVNKLRNSNTFINYGFLKNRSTNSHSFTSTSTTLNRGVIEDYTGFVFSNANMDNQGIILIERTSTGCPSDTIFDILELGDHSDFSITGIFADNPGRSQVANFDSVTNKTIQTDIFPVTSDWLWVVKNIHTACEDTMRMKVNVTCPVVCTTGDTNYWTGCMETDVWETTDNWTSGMPVFTDEVIIPFMDWRPYPLLTDHVTIHSLEIRSGAALGVLAGSLLTIQ